MSFANDTMIGLERVVSEHARMLDKTMGVKGVVKGLTQSCKVYWQIVIKEGKPPTNLKVGQRISSKNVVIRCTYDVTTTILCVWVFPARKSR